MCPLRLIKEVKVGKNIECTLVKDIKTLSVLNYVKFLL